MALAAPARRVYVTGRTTRAGTAPLPGTIHETAAEIEPPRRPGHRGRLRSRRDDTQVAAVFAQIARDSGRLDLLVNNVTAIPDELVLPGGFWEKPLSMQAILDVGLALALRGQLARRAADGAAARGADRRWFHPPVRAATCTGPAYGAGKAGIDKMSADMCAWT